MKLPVHPSLVLIYLPVAFCLSSLFIPPGQALADNIEQTVQTKPFVGSFAKTINDFNANVSKAASSVYKAEDATPVQRCLDIISEVEPTTKSSSQPDSRSDSSTGDKDKQTGGARLPLSVCIYKAMIQNRLIHASKYKIASTDELIKKARSLRMGKLSLNLFESKYNDSIAGFIGEDTAFARNINFDLPIYAGGVIKSAQHKARIGNEISRLEAGQLKQDITMQTIESYLYLLKAQWMIKVGEEYLHQTDLQLKLIEDRMAAGAAVKSDRLRVEVARNQAELNLIAARNGRKRALIALNLAMASQMSGEITATAPKRVKYVDEDLLRGIGRARIKRPELLIARSALNLLREEVTTAKAKMKPTVGFNLVYGDANSTFISNEDSTNMTLAGKIPLFEGGGLRADVHHAQQAVNEQKERIAFLEQSIEFEVTQAHINMTEARERMTVAIDNIESATENARIIEEQYKAGTAIVLELVDSQFGVLKARTTVLESLVGYFLAAAGYYRATGDIWALFDGDLQKSLKNSKLLNHN